MRRSKGSEAGQNQHSARQVAVGDKLLEDEDVDENDYVFPISQQEGLQVLNLAIQQDHPDIDESIEHQQLRPTGGRSRRLVALGATRTKARWNGKVVDFKQKLAKTASTVNVFTMYKSKDKKVHPRDDIPSDGTVPEGDPLWKQKRWKAVSAEMLKSPPSKWFTPKFSKIEKGSRLKEERLSDILAQVENTLTAEEKTLFLEILYNREAALSWDFTEAGTVDPLVAPPQKIKTVPHSAWQAGSMPIPKGIQGKVVDLLKERITKGVLEESHASYRNPWFVVVKKDGGFRLINSATRYNKHTIRDALQPPGADEFAEDFALCQMVSLLDFFSGYDQVQLDESSRDLTTFSTSLGLLRMCTLPQGATNSVAQFTRIITRILFDLIPTACRAFLDDIVVRGPTTRYDDEEVEHGVRRYVLEHLQNLDKVLVNVELAGCTISGPKSKWCQNEAVIVGYLCGTNGRKPDNIKIQKILEWTTCANVAEVRAFLGITGYYRQWVEGYGVVAIPLTKLLRKAVEWEWGDPQQAAMDTLKHRVTTPPILISIIYGPDGGEIILMIDASLEGWGAVLMQVYQGKRHPIRFESGTFNDAQKRYDACKRECRAVLFAVKRLRGYLYGVHFTLETDAQVLVSQLNGAANDVPGAMIIRWMSYILLFDFTVRHVPGVKNGVADGLSRKPRGPSDILDDAIEGDFEEALDIKMSSISLDDDPAKVSSIGEYSDHNRLLARFLQTFEKPEGISKREWSKIRAEAKVTFIQHGKLWRRPKGAEDEMQYNSPALIIDDKEVKKRLVREMHVSMGHKGRDQVLVQLRRSYWWTRMYSDVEDAIASCPTCQAFGHRHPTELSIPALVSQPFVQMHFDAQFVPPEGPFGSQCKAILEGREHVTGWVEAVGVRNVNAMNMRNFFQAVTWRWGVILEVLLDGGSETFKEMEEMLKDCGIKHWRISAYNPRANGLVEGGHYTINRAISRLAFPEKKWRKFLAAALFADRIAVRASTKFSPFYLMHGFNPLLPLEVEVPTWRLINWNKVHNFDTLLDARIRILTRMHEDVEKARQHVNDFRRGLALKRNASKKHTKRRVPIHDNDLVLKYEVRTDKVDKSSVTKYLRKWSGPYKVREIGPDTHSYRIAEMDGVEVPGSFPPERIKKFVEDEHGWWNPVDPNESDEEWNDERLHEGRPRTVELDSDDAAWEGETFPEGGDLQGMEEDTDAVADEGTHNYSPCDADGETSEDEEVRPSIRRTRRSSKNHPAAKGTIEVVLPRLSAQAKEAYTEM